MPTDFGANGTGIWGSVNGGALNDIDNNAQWIWSANNNTWTYNSTDDFDFIRVNLGVTDAVVPEPPTVLLFMFAGALFVIFGRRKLLKTA